MVLALPGNAVPGDWKVDFVQGEQYLKSREYPEAQSSFENALEKVKKAPGRKTVDLVKCMETLADALYRQEKMEEALKLYKKALKELERAYGKESILIVPTLKRLGAVYEGEGDFKKAAKIYARAVQICSRVTGENSLDTAVCLHMLGRTQFEQGLTSEARESYFSSLISTLEQKSLPDSLFLEELLSDYTDLMRKSENRGRILKSKFQRELLEDRIGELRKKRGVPLSAFSKEVSVRIASGSLSPSSSPSSAADTGGTTKAKTCVPPVSGAEKAKENGSVGGIKVFHSPDDLVAPEKINEQRVQFYKRMIEVDIKSLGPDHPSVARDLRGLANVYLAMKEYDEARPLLLRALRIYRNSYSPDSSMIKQTRLLLQLISSQAAEIGRAHV